MRLVNDALCGLVLFAFLVFVSGTGHAFGAEFGKASWYGPESGTHMANGERFRWGPGCRTAAHRTYPLGAKVRVTDLASGASLVVRITDRGPARWTGKMIDLCRGAMAALVGIDYRTGKPKRGVARVKVERQP